MTRIRYDHTELHQGRVGSAGLSSAGLDSVLSRRAKALGALRAFRSRGGTFLDAAEQPTDDIERLAASLRASFTDLVVFGIGGSSLGARAAWDALVRPRTGRFADGSERHGLRLHFVENVDASDLLDVLDGVPLESTAFAVITKSGSTIETLSSFLIVRDLLISRFGLDGYRARVVAVTDPEAGSLRRLVRDDGLRALSVPPNTGGRFSVLTSVGLLPLAAAGIDIASTLRGARGILAGSTGDDGAAALFATHQVAFLERGMSEVVLMPYVQGMATFADWFVQLWAESLGKLRVDPATGDAVPIGPTPIRAVGAVDQHSQLQLFMEGPARRSVVFIESAESRVAPVVPWDVPPAFGGLAHLGGRSLDEIRRAELLGVRSALRAAGRPSATLTVPRIDAESIGSLFAFFEVATAWAGYLLGVDPFDQPGVELAKKYAHGLLGRASDEALAREVARDLADERQVVDEPSGR